MFEKNTLQGNFFLHREKNILMGFFQTLVDDVTVNFFAVVVSILEQSVSSQDSFAKTTPIIRATTRTKFPTMRINSVLLIFRFEQFFFF